MELWIKVLNATLKNVKVGISKGKHTTSRIGLGGENVAGSPDTPRSYGGHDGGKG